MLISKRHIPRRTFLRDAGTSLALPYGADMLPAAMGTKGEIRQQLKRNSAFIDLTAIHLQSVNSGTLLQNQRPHAAKGMSCDNRKIDYLIRVTDITAKTPTWRFLPYRSDSSAWPLPDRQSWFTFSDASLNTRDEFAGLNALFNVQDERSSRPNIPSSSPHVRGEPGHWAETDSLDPTRDMRVYMRLANWIINRAYQFRCIPTLLANVRLREEPWFILNGFHPPAETSLVFAFGFVKTSGGFAALA